MFFPFVKKLPLAAPLGIARWSQLLDQGNQKVPRWNRLY